MEFLWALPWLPLRHSEMLSIVKAGASRNVVRGARTGGGDIVTLSACVVEVGGEACYIMRTLPYGAQTMFSARIVSIGVLRTH